MVTAEFALTQRVSRRRMLGETLLAVAGVGVMINLPPMMQFPFFKQQLIRPDTLGVTFSQLQCSPGYLNLDYKEAFKEICDLGIDIVRLPTYWNEITSATGFEKTDWLMAESAKRNIGVILTVGAKSPRYPELHLPSQIEQSLELHDRKGQQIGGDPDTFQRVIDHIGKVVERYKEYPNLRYWQVENEPLDSLDFADNHSIDPRLLQAEVDLVNATKKPTQELLLSNAFNIPSAKNSLIQSLALKPYGTGFNIYQKVPREDGGYNQLTWGNYQELGRAATFIRQNGIEPWIFEVQAEPWENGKHVHFGEGLYPSSSPEQTLQLVSDLAKKGFNKQLLWGAEFWVKEKQLGYPKWMDQMRKLFSQSS